jgi:serine protease Do
MECLMSEEKSRGVRTNSLAATAALALSVGLGLAPVSAQATPFAPSFAPLVDQVKGAVVNIATTEVEQDASAESQDDEGQQIPPQMREFLRKFGGQGGGMRQFHSGPVKALGSGFIVDASGFVVTNNHVVRNGKDIKVTLQDGTTLNAKVVGTDPVADLAVLKVEAGHPLPFVPFGDSGKSRVGDWVVSVGNPFGLGGTVTAGIVSASGRDVPSEEQHSAYLDYLQIDAPINQGNSGGPTFNDDGQVIGINTAIYSPNGGGSVGIGFAIPSNIAKPIVEELEKSGSVTRGWLGVQMQAITPDMEDALDLKSTNGVVVAEAVTDGPAAKGGIKSGDVIVGFNDDAIKSSHELALDVANTHPGQTARLKILRDGKEQTVSVTIEKLKADKVVADAGDADGSNGGLGLSLAPLDKNARQQLGLSSSATGVVVSDVKPDSPADQKGIRSGDLIVQVDSTKVENPRDAADAVKKATKAGKKAVLLRVTRDGNTALVPVPLAKDAG